MARKAAKEKEGIGARVERLRMERGWTQEELAEKLPGKLGKALERSNRIMAEDLLREAGYMLPQSGNAKALLEMMEGFSDEPGFPKEAFALLRSTLQFNEA